MKKVIDHLYKSQVPWPPMFILLLALGLVLPQFTDMGHAVRAQRGPAAQPEPPTLAPIWIGTWGAAPVAGLPNTGLASATFRNIIHTSVAGSTIRVQLSNAFGTQPILISQATVALPATKGSAAVKSGTLKTLTFGGVSSITIPIGSQIYSDALAFSVPTSSDLMVTVYTPHATGLVTTHIAATQTSFYSTGGDHSTDLTATAFTHHTGNWFYITDVEVQSSLLQGTLVALGDSITNGAHSTSNANHRWPDYLASRLLQLPISQQYGILNEGISGNRILTDANNASTARYQGISTLHRLSRDAFEHGKVKVLILLEGINDIKSGAGSSDIIAAIKQIATLAHAYGIRVLVGTILPFGGGHSYNPQIEAIRENVNTFIRSNIGRAGSSVFDAIIDFDATMRDPRHPLQLLPAYDSGDHLHPNDSGDQAMGNTISLAQL